MKKVLSVMLIASFLAFFGCKKDSTNPLDPGTGSQTGNSAGQPVPSVPNVDGTLTTILFGYAVPIIGSVDYAMGYAQFGIPNGVNGGTVSVNSNTISPTTSGSNTYYSSFSSTNVATLSGVNFDGTSSHTWTVAGGNGVPAFSGSVVSPRNFAITSPLANASVTKTSGIMVTWSVIGSSTSDSVMIVLVPTSSGSTAYTSATVANNGTHTIPASALGSISGDVMLQVVKFRYALKTVSSKNYAIIAEIVRTQNFRVL